MPCKVGAKRRPPFLPDHTVVGITFYRDGELHSREDKVWYEKIAHPSHLPDVALCDGTIVEWENWHRAHKTAAWYKYKKWMSRANDGKPYRIGILPPWPREVYYYGKEFPHMGKEWYFVIQNADGKTYVHQLSRDELLEQWLSDPEDDYCPTELDGDKALDEIPESDTGYWGPDRYVIIKGRIVLPMEAKRRVVWDIE